METDEEILGDIYSKCLGMIKQYLNDKTRLTKCINLASNESDVDLNLILEVSNALKALGEGMEANILAIEEEEEPEP
jgi:hypothetical protein